MPKVTLLLAVAAAVICSNAQATIGIGQWRDYDIGIHETTLMQVDGHNQYGVHFRYYIKNKGTTTVTKDDVSVYQWDGFLRRYNLVQVIRDVNVNGVIFRGSNGGMESFLLLPQAGASPSVTPTVMPTKQK